MRDPLADALVVVERRLLSLERRFRELAASSAKYLFQLLDVSITYDGPEAVVDGDVLTYDAALEKWVNAAPSGAGQYASIRVDDEEGTGTTLRWSLASEPGLFIEPVTSGGTRGAVVTAAGVYQVNAWAWSDGTAIRVLVYGPQIDVDSEPCLGQSAADDGVTGAAASTLMALPAGGHVAVTVTHDGTVARWTLTMHLVHEADVAEGDCGE